MINFWLLKIAAEQWVKDAFEECRGKAFSSSDLAMSYLRNKLQQSGLSKLELSATVAGSENSCGIIGINLFYNNISLT